MGARPKNKTSVECFHEGYKVDPSGCWIWQSQRTARYPRITHEGKGRGVHVASWMIHRGPVPSGLKVCHECDVPRCVNPAHLFLGTQSDNLKDMGRKRRHGAQRNPKAWAARIGTANSKPGERNPAAKMTQADVDELRRLRGEGWSYSRLMKRFKIGKTQVARIVRGQSW